MDDLKNEWSDLMQNVKVLPKETLGEDKEQESIRLGIIGETAVKLDLLRKGYEVYMSDDNTSLDMIAKNMQTGDLLRIEVKATRRKTPTGWVVDIRKSYGDYPFNHEDVDYLAVFIEPLNRIVFLNTKHFTSTSRVTILDKDLKDPKKSFDIT